jgi:hypothetical protein
VAVAASINLQQGRCDPYNIGKYTAFKFSWMENSAMQESKHYTGSISQLRPLLREAMEHLPLEAQDAVISLLPSCLEQSEGPEDNSEHRHVNISLNEANVYYAIHNSDLNLLKEATSVAAACYALLQNPVAVVGGLVVLLFQYRRKRVKLTGEQGITLKTLRRASPPGWTAEQLLTYLPLNRELSVSDVRLILESLKAVMKTDGSETSLVREKDGYWLAVDV